MAIPMNTLMTGEPRKHRITADEYHRMAEVGLLAPDARVELIAGEIIDMAPIGTDHCSVVDYLTEVLAPAVRGRAILRVQGAIRLDSMSEPQPDIALLVPRADRYRGSHPSPAEVLLVIEVSDSTLRYDRDVKVALYALRGIREVWLVDLQHGELHCYRSPQGDHYVDHSVTRKPGVIAMAGLPGVEVDLSQLVVDNSPTA